MSYEVVFEINRQLLETIKEIVKDNHEFVKRHKAFNNFIKEYTLDCIVCSLKHYKEDKTEIFEQPVKVVYKSAIYQREFNIALRYKIIHVGDKGLCISLVIGETKSILLSCRKIRNFNNKAIDKIKTKIMWELDPRILGFIRRCKEIEKTILFNI